jgi:hypothetical protein
MTEQRTTPEAKLADQVTELFTESAYDTEEAEGIREDLATLSPEELRAGLIEASGVIEGFVVASEALSMVTFLAASDARRRVHEAVKRATQLSV